MSKQKHKARFRIDAAFVVDQARDMLLGGRFDDAFKTLHTGTDSLSMDAVLQILKGTHCLEGISPDEELRFVEESPERQQKYQKQLHDTFGCTWADGSGRNWQARRQMVCDRSRECQEESLSIANRELCVSPNECIQLLHNRTDGKSYFVVFEQIHGFPGMLMDAFKVVQDAYNKAVADGCVHTHKEARRQEIQRLGVSRPAARVRDIPDMVSDALAGMVSSGAITPDKAEAYQAAMVRRMDPAYKQQDFLSQSPIYFGEAAGNNGMLDPKGRFWACHFCEHEDMRRAFLRSGVPESVYDRQWLKLSNKDWFIYSRVTPEQLSFLADWYLHAGRYDEFKSKDIQAIGG